MLIIHRVTPFFIALFAVLGIAVPQWTPIHSLASLAIAFVAVLLLLCHLGGGKFREPRFWFLIGSPLLFVLSSYTLILFLENDVLKLILSLVTGLLVFFFTEHLFTYLHLTAAYQVHAIEHMSLVMNVVSIFFVSASLFGFRLFLSLPLWFLAPLCFAYALFLLASTLWICKVDQRRLWPYALGGAIMLTELFLALSFLPSGFFTNAALLAVFFYLYLGLCRAFVLQKLSGSVLRRYVVISAALVVLVIGTARWV